MDRIFYQDFLMNFPFDEKEFPIVNIRYTDSISIAQEYGIPFNIFDALNGYFRWISFQYLHDLKDINKWNEIFTDIKKCDGIILVDDLKTCNVEINEIKTFYLQTYYWNLEQNNTNIWLYRKKKNKIIIFSFLC